MLSILNTEYPINLLHFDSLSIHCSNEPLSCYDMPSTRTQKAKEKRSRQSDVLSDLENMDVMLGRYPRDIYEV